MFVNNYLFELDCTAEKQIFIYCFCSECFYVKYTFLFSDLEKDFDSLSKINTKKFIMDTAHQKEDLIHRFDVYTLL